MGEKPKAACIHHGEIIIDKLTMIQLVRLALARHFFRPEAGPLHVLDVQEAHGKFNIKLCIDTAHNQWEPSDRL